MLRGEALADGPARHGAPPRELPRAELKDLTQLPSMAETAEAEMPVQTQLGLRHLEGRLRAWPRIPANDRFFAASQQLAQAMHELAGRPVWVGFDEFCDPDIERATQAAIAAGAAPVVALDLMLMRAGDHAEIDVPRSIEPVRLMHAGVRVEAAWPFPAEPITRFMLSALQDRDGQQD